MNKTNQIITSVLVAIGSFLFSSHYFSSPSYPITAVPTVQVVNGGTGSTTLSGILNGNGTSAVRTTTTGDGLTYSGTTLSFNGSPSSQTWVYVGGLSPYLKNATTSTQIGILVNNSSSTISFLRGQSLIYDNGTTTNATSTNRFSTTASSTNLFSSLITIGSNALVIGSSNNVGLSSSTPGTILSIGNTGANTINIDNTSTSTFGFGINVKTGCLAVNGTCVGGGGSQTPWTSNIDGAGFNLLNVGAVVATSTTATSTNSASSTSSTGFIITNSTTCPMAQNGNCYPYMATSSSYSAGTTTISGIPVGNIIEGEWEASTTSALTGAWIIFNNSRVASTYEADVQENSAGAFSYNTSLSTAGKLHNNTNKSYHLTFTIVNLSTGFKRMNYIMTGLDANYAVLNLYQGSVVWKSNAQISSIDITTLDTTVYQSGAYMNLTVHN